MQIDLHFKLHKNPDFDEDSGGIQSFNLKGINQARIQRYETFQVPYIFQHWFYRKRSIICSVLNYEKEIRLHCTFKNVLMVSEK